MCGEEYIMAWVNGGGSGYDINVGEKFDGRMLFHKRRHDLHVSLMEHSVKSYEDPKFVIKWCADLKQLHRMLWGLFEVLKIKLKPKEGEQTRYTERTIKGKVCKFKDSTQFERYLNPYLEKQLNKCWEIIEKARTLHTRQDGGINVIVDAKMIEENKIIKKLDDIQKLMAIMEYRKNLDLPQRKDPGRAIEDIE